MPGRGCLSLATMRTPHSTSKHRSASECAQECSFPSGAIHVWNILSESGALVLGGQRAVQSAQLWEQPHPLTGEGTGGIEGDILSWCRPACGIVYTLLPTTTSSTPLSPYMSLCGKMKTLLFHFPKVAGLWTAYHKQFRGLRLEALNSWTPCWKGLLAGGCSPMLLTRHSSYVASRA